MTSQTLGTYDGHRLFDQILRVLVTSLTEAVGAAAAGIAAFDGEGRVIPLVGTPASSECLVQLDLETIASVQAAAHDRVDLRRVSKSALSALDLGGFEDAMGRGLDLLLAPIDCGNGTRLGTLWLGVAGGQPLSAEQERRIGVVVTQAQRAILADLQRSLLAEEARLSETARSVVSTASATVDPESFFVQIRSALLTGFRADRALHRIYPDPSGRTSASQADGDGDAGSADPLRRLTQRCLEQGRVAALSASARDGVLITHEEHDHVTAALQRDGLELGLLMWIPLGLGDEVLGHLAISRRAQGSEWTDLELETALEVGDDIGRAIYNARALDRARDSVARLKTLDGYKNQLIAAMSQELGPPLASITGQIGLIRASARHSESSRRSLESMQRSTRRMSRVVEDLEVLAQVEDPQRPLSVQRVDLREVANAVAELWSVEVGRRGLELRVLAGEGPVPALGNLDEIERALANLVSNAVKYSTHGGRIEVAVSPQGDEVEVLVTDEGIGIGRTDQEQLFTEFFRSRDPAASAQPGTGLGLAIVHRIVRRHGGTISVESEPGQGSTLRMRLPSGGLRSAP